MPESGNTKISLQKHNCSKTIKQIKKKEKKKRLLAYIEISQKYIYQILLQQEQGNLGELAKQSGLPSGISSRMNTQNVCAAEF